MLLAAEVASQTWPVAYKKSSYKPYGGAAVGNPKARFGLTMAAFLAAAGQTSLAAAGPQSCRIERKGQLSLTESHGRFSAPVLIERQPLPMLIDTGAQRAALSSVVADRLKLPGDKSLTFRAVGIAGPGREEHPRIASAITFGATTWPNYPLQTSDIVRPEQAGEPGAPVGLIGADMLSAYDIEIDFPGRVLRFYAVAGCTGAFVPWTGPFDRFTPEPVPADMFVIPVMLNGRRLRALLDTGSNTSGLSLSAAAGAGVGRAALKKDARDTHVGATGVAVTVRDHRFQTFSIGNAVFRGVRISVQDHDFAPFDMLLGIDFLRSRRVWLSYATRQVFIQPAPSRP
jgi:predicted aspartyl protease